MESTSDQEAMVRGLVVTLSCLSQHSDGSHTALFACQIQEGAEAAGSRDGSRIREALLRGEPSEVEAVSLLLELAVARPDFAEHIHQVAEAASRLAEQMGVGACEANPHIVSATQRMSAEESGIIENFTQEAFAGENGTIASVSQKLIAHNIKGGTQISINRAPYSIERANAEVTAATTPALRTALAHRLDRKAQQAEQAGDTGFAAALRELSHQLLDAAE